MNASNFISIRSALADRMLLVISLAAVAVRLAAVPLVHSAGYASDEKEYLFIAQELAANGRFVDSNGEFAKRSPLYPMLLSGLQLVFGNSVAAAHILGSFAGGIVVILLYMWIVDLCGDRSIARIAAAICAGYPGMIVMAGMVMTEAIYVAFLIAALVLTHRLTTSYAVGSAIALGVISGLAALTKAVFLAVVPALALVILQYGRWKKRSVVMVGLAVTTMCIVIAPWTIRNYSLFGTLVPISSWSGSSFLIGNNPFATGTWSVRPGFEEWFHRQAEENGVRIENTNEVQRDRLSWKIGLRYIVDNPGEAVFLAVKKAHMFWIYPISHSDSAPFYQTLAVAGDVFVYLLAMVGFSLHRNASSASIVICALLIIVPLLHIVMHAESRYRLPVMPAVIAFSAAGLAALQRGGLGVLPVGGKAWLLWCGVGGVMILYGYTSYLYLTGSIH